MRPRDHISCTLWDIIYTAVYGRRQCSNFARALHLSREFVPAKRICSCEENCRQTYTDWTAVSPKQQKQESLTCFIRFYLTVLPGTRANARTFLARCGLSFNRPMRIISVSKGLSLNDSCWVVGQSPHPFLLNGWGLQRR